MKINIDWLSDYVEIKETPEELAQALTMAGLEVEGIEKAEGDTVFELGVTPNRPDWLSHVGVAREVGAIFSREIRMPETDLVEEEVDIRAMTSIEIENPEGCPRYSARVVLGVKLGPSPEKVAKRLESVGVRAISNVVDATNYVMLELGQPLHAFDYHRLSENRIVVRKAYKDEVMETLDGQRRTLETSDLLICDGLGSVALAGIMGGLNSEVMENTHDLLLESACFDPSTIRRSSKRLGLSTEASYRFERGTDPEGTVLAVDRLAFLIREWAGGKVCQGVWDSHPVPEGPRSLSFRVERVSRFLGVEVPDKEILGALERLGLAPSEGKEGTWTIEIPGFRRDLAREEDVIEEVARIFGYDRIPVTLPVGRTVPVKTSAMKSRRETARNVLEGLGFSEAVTYTFVSREEQEDLGFAGDTPPVTLMNPISDDMTVMRKSLLPGLLRALKTNISRRVSDVRLYEAGRIFLPLKGEVLPRERHALAGVMSGVRSEKTWYRNEEQGDFFDIKGAVQTLLDGMDIFKTTLEEVDHPCLQPGQGVGIMSGGDFLGIMGTLHPEVREKYRIREWAGCFELDLEELVNKKQEKTYRSIGQYPFLLRDLAVLVPREIPARRIEDAILAAGKDLEAVRLFDLYEGKGIQEGLKSLAFSLAYRRCDRTLTDEEVDGNLEAVVAALKKEFGARLR